MLCTHSLRRGFQGSFVPSLQAWLLAGTPQLESLPEACPQAANSTVLHTRSFAASTGEENDGFSVIASSMKACLGHLGPWSIGDLAFGLNAVADLHDDDIDAITGTPFSDPSQLQSLFQEVAIADAVYEASAREMAQACLLHQRDILAFERDSDHFKPAFATALCPEKEQVMLIVRGTQTLADALTNLTGACTQFQGGQAHEGMLRSARWLLTHETPRLSQLLSERPGWSLRLIGHSLGAGTLSLLAMMLQANKSKGHIPEETLMSCLCVAPPAVVSRDLAMGCEDYITSLVCHHDVIPRASLWAFEALREEVANANWEQDLKDQVAAHRLSKLAQTTANSISQQYKSVVDATTKALAGLNLSEHADRLAASASDTWKALSKGTEKHTSAASGLLKQARDLLEQLPQDRAEKVAQLAAKDPSLSLSSVSEMESPKEVELARQLQKEGADKEASVCKRAPRLYAPGRLLFLQRSAEDVGKYTITQADTPEQRFQRIVLNRTMLKDHLCTTYKAALRGMLKSLPKS